MTATPSTLTLTATDPDSHIAMLRRLLDTLTDAVITIGFDDPSTNPITCTVARQDWSAHPDELLSTTYVEPGRHPPTPGDLVTAIADINRIHIW